MKVAPPPSPKITPEPNAPVVEPIIEDEIKKSGRLSGMLLIILILAIASIGIFYSRSVSQQGTDLTATPTITPLFLSFTSPSTDTTAVNGEVVISGNTSPGATIMVYSDVDESIIESSVDGVFETSLIVGEMGGPVRITAVSETGEEKTETFMITPADVLGKSDVPPGQAKKEQKNETAAAMQEKTNNKPETTGKPEKTSTKVGAHKLKELITSESTGSSITKAQLKLAKMEAKVASAATSLNRHAVSGVIIEVSGQTITLAHQIQRDREFIVYTNEFTIVTSKGNEVTLATLAPGMRIAAVGHPQDDGILAKRIHVIPGLATGVFTKNPVATLSATPSLGSTPSATPTSTASATPTETLTPTPTL